MKKFACIALTMIMLFFFLFAPKQALSASQNGLMLWFNQLLPTLLPFTVLSYVILRSNLFAKMSAGQTKEFAICPITPPEWYVIFCGFLFGFPIGSKLTGDLYQQKYLSREKAELLFLFTNNLSPVFVTSVFCNQLCRRPTIITYLLLYGIPLGYGIFRILNQNLRQKKRSAVDGTSSSFTSSGEQKNAASRFDLNMQIIDAGIINGFETLIKICGYVMLFSLAAEIIQGFILPETIKTLLIGLTEVTNGMSALSQYTGSNELRYLLAMLFLSWGGISGLFQTASIVSHTDLSMKKYLATRLLLVLVTILTAGLLLCFGID